MGITINTNTSASLSALNLNRSQTLLQKSLARLSSGSRISEASDDAGGLAVSMKLSAAIKRTDAQYSNVSNALSYLQTQDGVLKSASSVMERIAELATLYGDVTKSDLDKKNYSVEFTNLVSQLTQFEQSTFNGVSLFSDSGSAVKDLTVYLTDDGSQEMKINKAVINGDAGGTDSATSLARIISVWDDARANPPSDSSGGLSKLSLADLGVVTKAIQELATLRATNGAQSSRLQYALDSLATNRTNLEAANSRIFDVDVAQETTRLARNNILVQSGAAMLAQANASSQIALKLLQ
jgi:flagellin